MTDREKAIVMAHTGICMLAGEKFGVFHAYIEDIMGRPVYTHELAIQSISDEIKEKSREDFIKLCKEEQEPCEDCISRVEALKIATTEYELKKIRELPSVNLQEPKWDRLYSWLNDMRFGIAPDETVTDIDERHVRTAQVDMLDEIMEWMIEPQESEKQE